VQDQDRWRAFFTSTLQDGIDAGLFTTSRDPALIALQINALTDGTVFPAIARNPAYDPDAFLAATITDLAHLLGVPSASR